MDDVSILLKEFDVAKNVKSSTTNRHSGVVDSDRCLIYVSQCKPSKSSKGHWNYDFFHTLPFDLVMEIADSPGLLVLLNYVDRHITVLRGADLVWIAKYSSRNKSNEGLVCDLVVEKGRDGYYYLRPYDRMRPERRRVEILS